MIYVEESEVSDLKELFESVEATLEENGFDRIDEYGVPCNFNPQYEYSQLSIYEYDDNSGFSVEYEITSESELVDMTLELKFIYTKVLIETIFVGVNPA